MNQHFLVHIILVHIILVHENLNKNLKLSLKNGREPELCEPELCEPFLWNYVNHGSHFPLVHTFPWFTWTMVHIMDKRRFMSWFSKICRWPSKKQVLFFKLENKNESSGIFDVFRTFFGFEALKRSRSNCSVKKQKMFLRL